MRNKPDFRRKPWPSISNSAKDFVRKLLVKDPRARLTAAQALCMCPIDTLISNVDFSIFLDSTCLLVMAIDIFTMHTKMLLLNSPECFLLYFG